MARAVILLTSIATAYAGCPLSCSLAGDCINDVCVCNLGWEGKACQRLAFAKSTPGPSGFHAPHGSTTWGGSPIQSPDRKSYYMYASLTRNHTIGYFRKFGVIVTTRSSSPAGPYVMVDPEAGPYTIGPRDLTYFDGAWAQNPVVAKLRNRSGYVLFYAGGNSPQIQWDSGPSSIGVAFTSDLDLPWQRPEKPVLEPLATPHWEAGGIENPAVYVRSDNSILLAYRGRQDNGIAFASAPSWKGPYTRLYGGRRLFIDMELEDPYLVGTKQGLHMIMHYFKADNCTNCWTSNTEALPNGTCTNTLPGCQSAGMVGAHAFAPWPENGTGDPTLDSWTLAPMLGDLAGGYSLAIPDENGGTRTLSHREEPKLLWEWSDAAQEEVPTHLFNVVIDGQVPHWKFDESYIHAQPLAVVKPDVDLRIQSTQAEIV